MVLLPSMWVPWHCLVSNRGLAVTGRLIDLAPISLALIGA
jgi:hypothetical protein